MKGQICNFSFKHRNPEEVPDGFISDCRDNTLKELQAMADVSLKTAKVYDKYQFERIGFFSVDPDSTESMVIAILIYMMLKMYIKIMCLFLFFFNRLFSTVQFH